MPYTQEELQQNEYYQNLINADEPDEFNKFSFYWDQEVYDLYHMLD